MDRHISNSPAPASSTAAVLPRLMALVLLLVGHMAAQEPLATTPPWNQIPQDARPSASFAMAFGPWQAGYGQVDDTSPEADRCKAVAAMPLAAVRIPVDTAIAKGALVSPGIIPASTTDAELRAYVAAAAGGKCPPVGKRRPVPVAPVTATAPVPTEPVQVEAAKPVSAEIATALSRWEVRADGVDSSADAATKADLLGRLARLDDLVASPGDIPAILSAAKAHGLVAVDASYAAMLAAAKGGAAPATAAAPGTPATAPATPAAGAQEQTDAAPKFVVGVKARTYLFPDGTAWPPTAIPEAPLATVSLPALDDIVPAWVVRPGRTTAVPNRLIEHKSLDEQRFYAVEFSGYWYPRATGRAEDAYAFSVESNGPVTLLVDGRTVAKSDWAIPQDAWMMGYFRGNRIAPQPKVSNTAAGSIRLVSGRYHSVRVVACGAWRVDGQREPDGQWADGHAGLAKQWTPTFAGALLRVRVTEPDGEPTAIKLYTEPPKKKAKRDE
jgi:hypothetical protein